MSTFSYRWLAMALLFPGTWGAGCSGPDPLADGSGETVVAAGQRCESGPGCVAGQRITCRPAGGDAVGDAVPEVSAAEACWELIPGDNPASELILALARSADGGLLAAGESTNPDTRYGAALWKVSRDGRLEWSRTVPGRRGRIEAVAATPDGGYVAVGWVARSADAMYAWVLRLDALGALEWERVFDGGERTLGFDVAVDDDGGSLIVGGTGPAEGIDSDQWIVRLDAQGALAWERTLGQELADYAIAVQRTADGWLVAGVAQDPQDGSDLDLALTRLDDAGEVLWQRTIGDEGITIAQALAPTPDRGWVVAGVTERAGLGDRQGWLAKLDGQGSLEWQQQYGGARDQALLAVAATADGGYSVTGYAEDADSGIGRFWLLGLDRGGAVRWERRLGEEGGPVGTAVLQDEDGSLLVAGAVTEERLASLAPLVFRIGADGGCD